MDAAITRMLDEGAKERPSKPYPKKLQPSGQAFKDVVRVVYEAAGYKAGPKRADENEGGPKRAIENFVAEWRHERREAVARLTAGMEELRR